MSTLRNKSFIQSTYHNLIDDRCTRKMIAIDVDILQIKLEQRKIRFIECKRMGEPMSKGQLIALKELARTTHPTFKARAYILTGNPPYFDNWLEEVGGTNKRVKLNKTQLILWLDFDLEIEDFD